MWLPGVSERNHDLQNPTSPEKLLRAFAPMRLGPGDRVLDVGAGRGGPAVLLARTYGCSVVAVERFAGFADAARERSAGLRVEVRTEDGAGHPAPGDSYDAALCLGASFVYGGFEPTLRALAGGVRSGGHVVVGEPYARVPGQAHEGEPLPDLGGLLATVRGQGLRPLNVVTASDDDWDVYHSGHLAAVEDWLDENPDHPERAEVEGFREACVTYYLAERVLGWAVVTARVP